MKQARVDSKRRIILPSECPPGSNVTIEQLDPETWIVRRQGKHVKFKRILIPIIDRLPVDRQWEKVESAFGRAAYKKLRPPRD